LGFFKNETPYIFSIYGAYSAANIGHLKLFHADKLLETVHFSVNKQKDNIVLFGIKSQNTKSGHDPKSCPL